MCMLSKSVEYDYSARSHLVDRLCDEYSFLKRFQIGKSCGGRNITALRLGSSDSFSLIAAAFHGSERITSVVLLMFIEELCRAIKNGSFIAGINAGKILHGKGIIFVPCVNPDGYEISLHGLSACGNFSDSAEKISHGSFKHWNANLRGVDINHNFSAGWEELRKNEINHGITGPSASRFGGYHPESEPETTALVQLCKTVNIRQATALHSQGEVIYWSYGKADPPRAKKMAEIMSTSSGYALDTPTGLAVGGGFKDWFITEFCRPAFTVELGLGENPLPPDEAEKIYHRVREMLMLCVIM